MKVKVCKLEKIKLLTKDKELVVGKETIDSILPTYGTKGDACMDVYPIYSEMDDKKDRIIYHTGLAFAIGNNCVEYDGTEIPNEMELRPRSNLTKSNWYIPNAPGTLDWGYRGELLIIFKHRTDVKIVRMFEILMESLVLPNNDAQQFRNLLNELRTDVITPPYICNSKDRCCQLLIRGSERIEWIEVPFEELESSERGEGGFGSTGGAVK